MEKEITVVFFDIDGTLLDTHGAGREAFARALRAVFGRDEALRQISFAGATDLDVFRQVTRLSGIEPTAEEEDAFFRRLPQELEQTLAATPATTYPGVRSLVEALARDPRVLLGLVTGNIEPCARLKLASADLHGHFLLGAFGREHADRDEIARRALQRARQRLLPGQRFCQRVLIGDTPADVRAARAIGALAVAVATGKYSAGALKASGADHVLEDLSDTAAVLRLLGL